MGPDEKILQTVARLRADGELPPATPATETELNFIRWTPEEETELETYYEMTEDELQAYFDTQEKYGL
ncbi:MAG TPA: hypothetical protein VLA24_09340 [Pseudomonadales bacterium]|nr:hypothetical protein [Pseudomonadales bacterium]